MSDVKVGHLLDELNLKPKTLRVVFVNNPTFRTLEEVYNSFWFYEDESGEQYLACIHRFNQKCVPAIVPVPGVLPEIIEDLNSVFEDCFGKGVRLQQRFSRVYEPHHDDGWVDIMSDKLVF
jgi:phenylpropionate dioxygenase-like ring-hydroxylating dioxygenase large terminal subunit